MYVFNTDTPPLLKKFSNILDLDPSLLRKELGETSYTVLNNVFHDDNSAIPAGKIFTENKDVTIRRFLRWSITERPIHYAEDLTRRLTITRGYKSTQSKTFQETTSLSASAEFDAWIFSVDVDFKKDLQITTQTSTDWTSEQVEEVTQTFKGNYTYISWRLDDVFQAVSKGVLDYKDYDSAYGNIFAPKISYATMECALSHYHDKVSDEDRAILDHITSENGVQSFNYLRSI